MRKSNKEIKDEAVIAGLLGSCTVGRLGTVSQDGYPMIKPLNFVCHEKKIYFHTAQEGEKIEDIRRDNRVCFEVDLPIAYVQGDANPCHAEYLYRSVIIRGRAHLIADSQEKVFALQKLMEKYQPDGGYGAFPGEKLAITGVVRIDIEQMTGKEDLGKGTVREAAQKALEDKAHLPIVVKRV
jgi:nitroimidazol reductase NimA-like FMN-containing flavoprotein (pyridoxamine 5'-phosphate oxidase superfamily)